MLPVRFKFNVQTSCSHFVEIKPLSCKLYTVSLFMPHNYKVPSLHFSKAMVSTRVHDYSTGRETPLPRTRTQKGRNEEFKQVLQCRCSIKLNRARYGSDLSGTERGLLLDYIKQYCALADGLTEFKIIK